MAASAEKLGAIVSSTYIGFALSVCKDVGILEVLMESQIPLTSQEIADRKELKERYVRELLGSLATAEVVHVSTNESGALVYHLDEDEKTLLRTHVMSLISGPAMMSSQYDLLKSCMSSTGPHGARFSNLSHDFVEETTSYFLDGHVDGVLKNVDGLKEKLGARFSNLSHDFVEETTSYFLDGHVDGVLKNVDGLKEKLESGIDVLEVGCGRGLMLAKFALMFPKSTFTASDNVDVLLDQLKARFGHIPNIKYELLDVCCPRNSPNKRYDWVYCANTMHDVPNPPEALKNIRKLLNAPGGTFAMIDVATSGSPMEDKGNSFVACLYAISTFTCVPESSIQENSQALGLCYGKERAIDFLKVAGFQVKFVDLEYPTTLFVCE